LESGDQEQGLRILTRQLTDPDLVEIVELIETLENINFSYWNVRQVEEVFRYANYHSSPKCIPAMFWMDAYRNLTLPTLFAAAIIGLGSDTYQLAMLSTDNERDLYIAGAEMLLASGLEVIEPDKENATILSAAYVDLAEINLLAMEEIGHERGGVDFRRIGVITNLVSTAGEIDPSNLVAVNLVAGEARDSCFTMANSLAEETACGYSFQ
jgi:hypothetical protein